MLTVLFVSPTKTKAEVAYVSFASVCQFFWQKGPTCFRVDLALEILPTMVSRQPLPIWVSKLRFICYWLLLSDVIPFFRAIHGKFIVKKWHQLQSSEILIVVTNQIVVFYINTVFHSISLMFVLIQSNLSRNGKVPLHCYCHLGHFAICQLVIILPLNIL